MNSEDETPDDPVPEEGPKKPVRSIPEKLAIFMDDLATKDNDDLSLLLGLDDPDDDDPDDDDPDDDDAEGNEPTKS